MTRFLAPVLSARCMTLMTSIPTLISESDFVRLLDPRYVFRKRYLPAVGYALDVLLLVFALLLGMLFLPAVDPLFCHPSRCSGPQASSLACRQSSVLDRASGFLSPASSSLVVYASRAALPSARCACRGRCLLEILQRDIAFSSSSLAVIMALHELPTMALHGSPASLHASPCFDKLFARPRADPRVLFLTILQRTAALAHRCAGWFVGLTSTTCVPSSLCAWRSFCFPRTLFILLW